MSSDVSGSFLVVYKPCGNTMSVGRIINQMDQVIYEVEWAKAKKCTIPVNRSDKIPLLHKQKKLNASDIVTDVSGSLLPVTEPGGNKMSVSRIRNSLDQVIYE